MEEKEKMEELEIEEVAFDEELYQKNLQENDFSGKSTDEIGDDE